MSRYWKSLVFCGLLFVTLELIGLQYPSAEYTMVRARWLIWGLGVGWRYWKVFPTFPRPSQNQTVSSGVEGAHEGTTADEKAELPREHQCVSANDCPLCDEYVPPKSGSRGGLST